MKEVKHLLEGLRQLLDRELAPAVVTTQYPYQQRKLPPDRPVVWLGVEKITASGSPFAPYLGEGPGPAGAGENAQIANTASAMGRELELVVRVEILDRQDGDACHRVFGELCEALLLAAGRPWVKELSCGSLSFDREAGAFRLVCKAGLRAVLTQEEEGRRLEKIIVKKEEKP